MEKHDESCDTQELLSQTLTQLPSDAMGTQNLLWRDKTRNAYPVILVCGKKVIKLQIYTEFQKELT